MERGELHGEKSTGKTALRKRLYDIAIGADPGFCEQDDYDLVAALGSIGFCGFLNTLRIEFELDDDGQQGAKVPATRNQSSTVRRFGPGRVSRPMSRE